MSFFFFSPPAFKILSFSKSGCVLGSLATSSYLCSEQDRSADLQDVRLEAAPPGLLAFLPIKHPFGNGHVQILALTEASKLLLIEYIHMYVYLCFAVPAGGQQVSGGPTETPYVLTMLSTHKERTSQDAANHGTWSVAVGSPTSHPDMARELHSSSIPSSPAWPGGRHVSSSHTAYTEPEVTFLSRVFTYFSAAAEPSSESF